VAPQAVVEIGLPPCSARWSDLAIPIRSDVEFLTVDDSASMYLKRTAVGEEAQRGAGPGCFELHLNWRPFRLSLVRTVGGGQRTG
jgi:hypothetical protein